MEEIDMFAAGAYVLTKDGEHAWCDQFELYYRGYKESGHFVLLAGAFVVCRNSGFVPPPYLLDDIHRHFAALSEADNKKSGLEAVGFASNRKGGAWQGKNAKAVLKAQQEASMMEDIEAFFPSIKKADLFAMTAKALPDWAATTAGKLKQKYYGLKRRKK